MRPCAYQSCQFPFHPRSIRHGFCSRKCARFARRGQARARQAALERDSYTCTACGSRHHLQVHHRRELSRYGTHRLSNLITLCSLCHRKCHTEYIDKRIQVKEGYVFIINRHGHLVTTYQCVASVDGGAS